MADKYALQKQQHDTFMQQDTCKLGELTANFVENFYPAYCVDGRSAAAIPQENSLELLNTFTFYRICECKVCDVEDKFAYFAQKMQQLFTTAYAIGQTVCYGIVSSQGCANWLIGVAPQHNDLTIKKVLEGLLPGIKLEQYKQRFANPERPNSNRDKDRYVGCISGTPALKTNGEYQRKDLAALIRSLNGLNYTIMVMCRPVEKPRVQEKIGQLIRLHDECFAISKRTLSLQEGRTDSKTHTDTYNETEGYSIGAQIGAGFGGAHAEGTTQSVSKSGSTAASKFGGYFAPVVGLLIELIVGNMTKGSFVSQVLQANLNVSISGGYQHSIAQGYSDAVSQAITKNSSISGEVQNGFALELMQMAESLLERLKIGRSIGMWESVISFSSDSEMAAKIIQGSLYNNMASGIPEILPPVVFAYKDSMSGTNMPCGKIHTQQLLIPQGFFSQNEENRGWESPLLSLATSEELCGICTIPTETTFGFNIEEQRGGALNYAPAPGTKPIGCVCEYEKPLSNMPFGLSGSDLNKHTFVCGITGSGKTNTVKKLLKAADTPFLVLEPVKKEYRNLCIDPLQVYTLGRPEINCLRLNPFYILPGISPQQHIDMLKDLFSASFAFYGPLPYIIEKCLHNVYSKRGWNLTLGFHPLLSDSKRIYEMFDADRVIDNYNKRSHLYLFPTMQDLKEEIESCLLHDKDMTYEGEVKGNIQGALRARINSLCVGSKGYIFNTQEIADFNSLLQQNAVVELEGLADDADKAFALGLLIIYISEFRQMKQEIAGSDGLQHLLVIEEAHRLLKNVSSEHTEELGNPKGKAVEHFTNMLAEMRSYGQGVIVAEQIPCKISPDVIKNSSNKIIHRLVSGEDQTVMANTVGLPARDAIYLGCSKTGYAVCHSEGMVQPVIVKIDPAEAKIITDQFLYQQDIDNKLLGINVSALRSMLPHIIDVWAVRTLLSLMYHPDLACILDGLEKAYEEIDRQAKLNSITLIEGVSKQDSVMTSLTEAIMGLMSVGALSNHKLLENDLTEAIKKILVERSVKALERLPGLLEQHYAQNPANKAVEFAAALVSEDYARGSDIKPLLKDFLLIERDDFSQKAADYLQRYSREERR